MGRLFGARRDTLATDDGSQQLLGDSDERVEVVAIQEGRKEGSHGHM